MRREVLEFEAVPYRGGMSVEWIGEARKVVAGLNERQGRTLYGTDDKETQAEIEAARMAESSRRKAAGQKRPGSVRPPGEQS